MGTLGWSAVDCQAVWYAKARVCRTWEEKDGMVEEFRNDDDEIRKAMKQ